MAGIINYIRIKIITTADEFHPLEYMGNNQVASPIPR